MSQPIEITEWPHDPAALVRSPRFYVECGRFNVMDRDDGMVVEVSVEDVNGDTLGAAFVPIDLFEKVAALVAKHYPPRSTGRAR